MAIMVALFFIFSRFLGINTDLIHLSFDFLPVVVIACLYGPIPAAITAILGDLACAIIMPLGMINPGITAVAGLIGLAYGICFYNRRLEGKWLLISTLIASLITAGILKLFGTTACLAVAYGMPYWPTLISRIPNCIFLFVVQIFLIPIIYRYVIKPVKQKLIR